MPKFGGLSWREKNIVMEENNRPANNEERNIFYEYFSKLEKADIDFEIPTFEEINNAYNNVKKEYESLMTLKENELNLILQNHNKKAVIFYKVSILFFKKGASNQYKSFTNATTKFLNISVRFFKQYKYKKNDRFIKLLSRIEKLIQFMDTLSLFQCRNLLNLIEHIYTIIICIQKKDYYTYYTRGYKILGITKIEIIFKLLLNLVSIHKKEFICIVAKLLLEFINYKLHGNKRQLNDSMRNEFRTYFEFADEAYNYNKYKTNISQDHSGIYYFKSTLYKPLKNKPCLKHPHFGFDFNNGIAGLGWHNNTTLKISFSGTQNLVMILVDVSQIEDLSPAYVFAVGFVDYIKDKYPNKNIVLCGHSLGGGLCQFATAALHNENVKAYCYNSAGLVGAYSAIKRKCKKCNSPNKIYHYRLKGDLISCFGIQLGEIHIKRVKFSLYNHCCKAIRKSLGL